jgi:hypothetical protein
MSGMVGHGLHHRLAGGRGGRNGFETVYHPRPFHSRWLVRSPDGDVVLAGAAPR